jgi:Ca2+-binding EF-hand superfamily protein
VNELFHTDNDGIIVKNEFIHGWTTRYGDKHHHTEEFFNNIDLNGNGMIDTADIEGNMVVIDTNGGLLL